MGTTIEEDEVIGIADFIINPIGSQSGQLISDLNIASGGVTISGIDPNKTLSKIVGFISSTSFGVSGCVSIGYSKQGLVSAGL